MLLLSALLLLGTSVRARTAASRAVIDVRTFGAVGDGITDDTHAFEKAIDAAGLKRLPDALPTRVLVPVPVGELSSAVYLIRPINLTSSIELYIEANVTIAGIANVSLWPLIPGAPSFGQGPDHRGPRHTSLLHGEHLHDVSIRGEGPTSIIDGRGEYWWKRHEETKWWKPIEKYTRGHLVEFMYSSDVVIADLTMKDSPFWFTHIYDCDRVHVYGVNITAPHENAPNTDGWDPDSSRNVLIENSAYSGADDCVAIKSGWDCFGVAYAKPSVNITVRNVTCDGPFSGIAIGSEISGGAANIRIEHVNFTGANGVAHIKTGPSRGGYVHNVTFADLTVLPGTSIWSGIIVDTAYTNRNPSCPLLWKPPVPTTLTNLTFERIDARGANVSKSPIRFWGNHGISMGGIRVADVFLPENQEHPFIFPSWQCLNVTSGVAIKGTVQPWPPCSAFSVEPPSDESGGAL